MSSAEPSATLTSNSRVAARPQSKSVTWGEPAPELSTRVRRTALCRETADGWVLQHVRTVTVGQRVASGCEIDTEPDVEALPYHVRAKLPDDLQEVSGGV